MSPVIIRIVVDLPAPLGPRKPVTVPGAHSNETSLTAVCAPYRLVKLVTLIMPTSLQPTGGSARRAKVDGSRRRSRSDIDFGLMPVAPTGRTI
ncbi:hypothetical protein Asi02nite_75360 [Asanoa siamensis]|uniref:Uncharacterized protein n=1 Tax=Asanoa siamensis TaxID=926357 RepID=A0ABQ4D3B6_9ACTN|nr:hypothetical protein Asi02nite_75360 [Asanoa siamensis]